MNDRTQLNEAEVEFMKRIHESEKSAMEVLDEIIDEFRTNRIVNNIKRIINEEK